MDKEVKLSIKVPLITDEDLRIIDNNYDSIIKQFLETVVTDKDLAIAKYIIKKQQEELDKYKCKRNDCGGRIKENNKPTDAEVLERLETWCKTQIDKLTDKAVSYGLFINKDVKYEIDLQISIYNKFLNTIKEFKG